MGLIAGAILVHYIDSSFWANFFCQKIYNLKVLGVNANYNDRHGIYYKWVRDSMIKGSHANENDRDVTGSRYGIMLEVFKRLQVTGNEAIDARAGAATQPYGLGILTSEGGNIIRENKVSPNLVGGVTGTFEYTDEVELGTVTIVKMLDETVNNSNVFQDDDDLKCAILANEECGFEMTLFYDTGTIPDIKFAVTVPAGATLMVSPNDVTVGPGGGIIQTPVITASGAVFGNPAGIGVGTIIAYKVRGYVLNGANAGNIQLQWAQNTANASDTKVKRGSFLRKWVIRI